jgi:hypothetical protein
MTESTEVEGFDRTQPEGLTGILDALTDAVTRARAMPMSSSVLLNRAELLDLLEQAREVLPVQLTRADELLADAGAARGAAQEVAETILAAARTRAAALVDAEHVTVAALERARQIVADAEGVAETLRCDADDYCDRRLADFEIDLGKVLAQVQAGRAKLAVRLGGVDKPFGPAS